MDCTKSNDQLYMQLNASELSAIIMKGSPHSNDRDAGFCSGSSEGGDDLSIIEHSRLEPGSPPTDASEDSNDLKVTPIALIARNKRKSSEPLKLVMDKAAKAKTTTATMKPTATVTTTTTATTTANCSRSSAGPLKKRIRYTSSADSAVVLTPPAAASPPAAQPTAMWDPSQVLPHELMPNPAQVFLRHPGVTTLHRDVLLDASNDVQVEPLALVLKKPCAALVEAEVETKTHGSTKATVHFPKDHTQRVSLDALPLPPPSQMCGAETESLSDELPCSSKSAAASLSSRPQQRNYKNMTRERRIEANARERTRVHTISAAYETLRHSVPSYSSSQKLSKLSVLRVACSYILTLSRMAGHDYSEDQSAPSIAECMEAVTATIQTEGKVKRKKDE